MITLILEFYFPAILIAAVITIGTTFLGFLYWMARKPERRRISQRQFFHDALIANLITIPVLSFAILALLVILRAR
ncbi:MAG: DUF4059 family protein [Streptococcaceae bacterium]|jgi:uncharacterized iron-regulated membrane protein|nr:DUF4059 family protein [Streptococcaceae bacterium]